MILNLKFFIFLILIFYIILFVNLINAAPINKGSIRKEPRFQCDSFTKKCPYGMRCRGGFCK
uniref:Uncharacterized protein n=1 Tax=Meloidogyne enterolobii TaxID=390850 RepID=A0A6V7U4B5_MELEN|nr:unnamed protein product [Meloidogyne enterolobii]